MPGREIAFPMAFACFLFILPVVLADQLSLEDTAVARSKLSVDLGAEGYETRYACTVCQMAIKVWEQAYKSATDPMALYDDGSGLPARPYWFLAVDEEDVCPEMKRKIPSGTKSCAYYEAGICKKWITADGPDAEKNAIPNAYQGAFEITLNEDLLGYDPRASQEGLINQICEDQVKNMKKNGGIIIMMNEGCTYQKLDNKYQNVTSLFKENPSINVENPPELLHKRPSFTQVYNRWCPTDTEVACNCLKSTANNQAYCDGGVLFYKDRCTTLGQIKKRTVNYGRIPLDKKTRAANELAVAEGNKLIKDRGKVVAQKMGGMPPEK